MKIDLTTRVVFVFGSNLAGIHGKGAALYAKRYHGAQTGVGRGPTGNAYAIPTKDEKLDVLPLDEIEKEVSVFCEYARECERSKDGRLFYLTPVGTGLAGYDKSTIAALFRKHEIPANVVLTHTWLVDD